MSKTVKFEQYIKGKWVLKQNNKKLVDKCPIRKPIISKERLIQLILK